ncbi:MAG: RagB/SusD family nutrient uptake outer membrane protein [Bacteroidetes bacterium]|nr:RagB/SusD family nutrient uptake outer membrane protein [Bacteroidota bacterium]
MVPTRGGDWDDNGVWRVVHNHTWNADHSQVLSVFNNLNKINFDATNVLNFQPSAEQAAEARFLRAYALYYLLDLYGQFPVRNPGDNLLNAPKVYSGEDAVQFLISEVTAAMPDLSTSNGSSKANQDAAKALLMRIYLNHGAFVNRAAPTFSDADMQQVITLGNQIISSGKYSYMSNYFDNFSATNGGSTEGIFGYPSTSGVATNNGGADTRWMMTFHYNEYDAQAPNAGWNGFSTIGDFYSSFNLNSLTNPSSVTFSRADTTWDTRLGGRTTSYPQTTLASGIRPGFLVNQQYDQNGVALKDRKGNPLAFDPTIASNMIETGSNLEVTGIRVAKYVPDFSDPSGKYYSSNSGNWVWFIRYPEVVLMVAEAMMRQSSPDNAGALALVNALRAVRGASPMTTMALVNTSNTTDPNTLLAERGRELYWESFRRTDLIRFGVFNVLWQYKPSDDPKYLVFPVPTQAIASNPNLKQNPGY